MTDCQHGNIEACYIITMSARGYHDCPVIVCLDCDASMPTGCDDDTCDHY